MALVFPPFKREIPEISLNVPDFSKISGNILPANKRDQGNVIDAKIKATDIFNLPLVIILINLANTIILVIIDIFKPESYRSLDSFLKMFLIENRLLYIGIFIILFTMFVSFFDF